MVAVLGVVPVNCAMRLSVEEAGITWSFSALIMRVGAVMYGALCAES